MDMNQSKLKTIIFDLRFILFFYVIVAIAVSVHKYFFGATNYITFATSFWDLFKGVDIYYPVLKTGGDYKYSPSFSVLFAPMAVLPIWIGATVWNLINTVTLYLAVNGLKIEHKSKVFILWFIIFEYITSIQNFQSNVLIAGLFLLTLNSLENKRPLLGALATVLSFFIKLFGGASGLLMFLYPNKKRFFLYGIIWGVVIALLPLLFVSPQWLIQLYTSWGKMMNSDLSGPYSYSVMMLINKIFLVPKSYVQLFGLLLLVLPLIFNYKSFSEYKQKLLFAASIMIWIVIFNHKAESPTFIIAAVGAAIWYVISKRTILDKILIIGLFIFTTLIYTDIPARLMEHYFDLPTVKLLPCLIVWVKVQFELLRSTK